MWYLNLYECKDRLKYKIVKDKKAYQKWNLLETYIFYKGKFFTLNTFRGQRISNISKKSCFKKVLEFFKNI